jgi:hypothetical protein
VPDPATVAIATKDIVTWIIGGVGIVASLGYNAFNHYRTNALREAGVRLTEFERVREPIDDGLRTLREARDDLDLLIQNAIGLQDLRNKVGAYNKEKRTVFVGLERALTDADDSRNISGDDWAARPASLFDEYLQSLNIVYAPEASEADTQRTLRNAVGRLDEIRRIVMKRLDDELVRYGGFTAPEDSSHY